jgi:predicted Fe-S protein YdhL (DUF1289 family)
MGYINSPCNNVCQLDKNDVCIGCFRTLDEIANWTKYNHDEKLRVMELIQQRK